MNETTCIEVRNILQKLISCREEPVKVQKQDGYEKHPRALPYNGTWQKGRKDYTVVARYIFATGTVHRDEFCMCP